MCYIDMRLAIQDKAQEIGKQLEEYFNTLCNEFCFSSNEAAEFLNDGIKKMNSSVLEQRGVKVMCLNDKEIVESVKYSEEAKDYKDSLKQDVKEMITSAKPYSHTIDNGIFYCKGREDMKQEIIKHLEEMIKTAKEGVQYSITLGSSICNQIFISIIEDLEKNIKHLKESE